MSTHELPRAAKIKLHTHSDLELPTKCAVNGKKQVAEETQRLTHL